MDFLLDGIGCLADLGLDGWIGSDVGHLLRRPSTHDVNAKTDQLHRFWFDKAPMSSDRISVSHGDSLFEQLSGVMKDLRDSGLPDEKRRQLQADVSVAMRRFVNPDFRKVKSLEDLRGAKIGKRAAKLREGTLSGIERSELDALHEHKSQFEAVRGALGAFRSEFAHLDKDQKIFTTGQKFRRNILNTWGAVARFSIRNRVLVVSAVTLALVLGTIGSFIEQRKRDRH